MTPTWHIEKEVVPNCSDLPVLLHDTLGHDVVEVDWESAMIVDHQGWPSGRQIIEPMDLVTCQKEIGQ